MGLYIPKMKMPKNCYDCQIENYVPNCPVYLYYAATEYMKERHPDCPLVEMKEPHGRLIDADKLVEMAYKEEEDGVTFGIDSAEELEILFDDDAPTVIEAEGE